MAWILPLVLSLFLGIAQAATPKPELIVYTYDSFATKGSLGAWIKEHSEKAIGVKTNFVAFGSAGEALNQLAIEGAKTKADLIVGIDQNLTSRAKELGALEDKPIDPGAILADDLTLDTKGAILPYDYGYLAFVYDSRRTKVLPQSLIDFAKNESFRKKVVLADPRTSSLGLSFLAWTRGQFSEDSQWEGFWRGFAKTLVTVPPSWSSSYGLFLKKQADFVLSYTTSPAYHLKEEKTEAFKAVLFPEGHFRQVEGAGLVKHSKRKNLAKKWLKYLLSEEVQKEVAERQWMYPARKGVSLPASFAELGPKPKTVTVTVESEAVKKEWLRHWTEWVATQSN